MQVAVATYNMSFMSDLETPIDKAQFASEATFLTSNMGERRAFWLNALSLLGGFIHTSGLPCVIGLQEINLTEPGTNTGSDAINQMLSTHCSDYIHVCHEVVFQFGKPALSIIFHGPTFGNVAFSQIVDNPLQPGRPLLVVITERGYVFVNLHGAQTPAKGGNKDEFNAEILRLTPEFVITNVERMITESGILPVDMFIMGDLNDRYDAIETFTIREVTLSYSGQAPLSCCHNWDSACSYESGRYKPFDENYGTCSLPLGGIVGPDGLKIPMTGEEAYTRNYRYRGDKVFGQNPASDIATYPGVNDYGPSQESDHQLVYAYYNIRVSSGGRRRKSRKYRGTKKQKKHNQKKHMKSRSKKTKK